MALGVAMVADAAQGYGDVSVLISTDSDFNPAIIASAEIARSARSTSRARPAANRRADNFRRT